MDPRLTGLLERIAEALEKQNTLMYERNRDIISLVETLQIAMKNLAIK